MRSSPGSVNTSLAAIIDGIIGGSGFPGYKAGLWYPSAGTQVISNGVNINTGITAFAPFIIGEKCTVEAIAIIIQQFAAGGNLQLALYTDDGTGQPEMFIDSTASISTSTAQVVSSSFINGNHQLDKGIYWAAIAYDSSAGGRAGCSAVSATTNFGSLITGSASAAQACSPTGMTSGYTMSQPFGTWGNASGLTAVANKQPPGCALQIFSVP